MEEESSEFASQEKEEEKCECRTIDICREVPEEGRKERTLHDDHKTVTKEKIHTQNYPYLSRGRKDEEVS